MREGEMVCVCVCVYARVCIDKVRERERVPPTASASSMGKIACCNLRPIDFPSDNPENIPYERGRGRE